MIFLHYVSLHLEEPNPSGRPPLDREWSWLLLQLRDAESEVWMLLGSWSRAMYRGFHRFVPWATNCRDTYRVIGTLRIYISCPVKHAPSIYFCLRPRWDLRTSKKIIILLCLRQKTVPKFLRLFVFLHFFRNTKLITHIWWKTVPL